MRSGLIRRAHAHAQCGQIEILARAGTVGKGRNRLCGIGRAGDDNLAARNRIDRDHRHRIGVYGSGWFGIKIIACRNDEYDACGCRSVDCSTQRRIHGRSAERHVDDLGTGLHRAVDGTRHVIVAMSAALVRFCRGASSRRISTQYQQCCAKGDAMRVGIIFCGQQYGRHCAAMSAFILKATVSSEIARKRVDLA